MSYPGSVQSWGSKICCISLMGKAPNSQTGDIPYYHPSVTQTWGSLLAVSRLDLFYWGENLAWERGFHGEGAFRNTNVEATDTNFVTSSRIKIWFLESPGWTTAFCDWREILHHGSYQPPSPAQGPAAELGCSALCEHRDWSGLQFSWISSSSPRIWAKPVTVALCPLLLSGFLFTSVHYCTAIDH